MPGVVYRMSRPINSDWFKWCPRSGNFRAPRQSLQTKEPRMQSYQNDPIPSIREIAHALEGALALAQRRLEAAQESPEDLATLAGMLKLFCPLLDQAAADEQLAAKLSA